MRKLALSLLSLSLVAFSGAAMADGHAAGAEKAEMCLDCHMEDDFAGKSAEEIAGMIREARTPDFGHSDEIQDLAEEDIDVVAAWFAAEGAK
jgi:cytochrome c553